MHEYEITEDKTVLIYRVETIGSDDGASTEFTRRLIVKQPGFTTKAKATEFAKAEVKLWDATKAAIEAAATEAPTPTEQAAETEVVSEA
jgi:hypothetical protein